MKIGALAGAVTAPTTSDVGLIGGLLICMWNYMGWDNASTIAAEVKRPQTTYPRAMLLAVWSSRSLTWCPLRRCGSREYRPSSFETGSWADLAGMMGGLVGGPLMARGFRVALVLGGMMSAFGMFNALVMSYSRLPLAMAQDGLLPSVFSKLQPKTRAPWVAITVLAGCWALCLGLGFERLVTIDVLLYGMSLSLEFVALIVLRDQRADAAAAVQSARRAGRGVILLRRVPRAAAGIFDRSRRRREDPRHERARRSGCC